MCGAFGASAAAAGAEVPRPSGANPNARGYEYVSPADVNANYGLQGVTSSNPDRVVVSTSGGVRESTAGSASLLEGTRTRSGWTFRSILPPAADLQDLSWGVLAARPDLSEYAVALWPNFGALPTRLSFWRGNGTGQLLASGWPSVTNEFRGVASDDLSHVYVRTQPPDADPDQNRYIRDIGTGSPVIVSRFPGPGGDADPVAPCGVVGIVNNYAGFAVQGSVDRHWTSTDGRRVFFPARSDPGNCPFGPIDLFVRDRGATAAASDDTSTLISGPLAAGAVRNDHPEFVGANADGSQVVFATATRLETVPGTPVDGNEGPDVYRFTRGLGNECLTCDTANGNVATGPWSDVVEEFFGSGYETTVDVSSDLSRVYFASMRALDDEGLGRDGEPNIYVLRDGELRYAFPAYGLQLYAAANGGLTPDGSVALFRSSHPRLDELTGRPNYGRYQLYRYDDDAPADARLTCVSCPIEPATGDITAPGVTGPYTYIDSRRMMTDDGRVIAFVTPDPLVSEDTNRSLDVYEWSAGVLTLLTNGSVVPEIDGVELYDVSRDGTNILFRSFTSLVPGTDASTGVLYNARAGGGFPPLGPPAERCRLDECQGGAPPPPPATRPGSADVHGGATSMPDAPRFSIKRLTRGQRSKLARGGTIALPVSANAAGTIAVSVTARVGRRTRVVARGRAGLLEGGRTTVPLQLSRAARRQLAARGTLRIRIAVDYSEVAAPRSIRATLRAGGRGAQRSATGTRGRGDRR